MNQFFMLSILNIKRNKYVYYHNMLHRIFERNACEWLMEKIDIKLQLSYYYTNIVNNETETTLHRLYI